MRTWLLALSSIVLVAPACGYTVHMDWISTDSDSGSDSSATDATDGPSEPEPLQGVADLHLHMFAENAFGGGWMHGTARGAPEVALAPCDGGDPGDHAWLRDDLAPLLGTCPDITLEELSLQVPLIAGIVLGGGALVSEEIGAIPGTKGDTGVHADRTSGWPSLASWPRWDTIAHQQSWEGHLKAAYDGGLRLEVVSAVSFNFLCKAARPENVERPQCDEMDDVYLQLQQMNELADSVEWAEIARSAADARRIIEEDKLALVLSVEASHVMGDGDWRAELDKLHALGVRTLQPVHQLDNRFGGAAPHNTIFHIAQYSENCHIDEDCGLTTDTLTLGFDVDANCKNTLGLTAEGRELVQEMMDRGMLVDAAHLSEQSVRDVYELAKQNDYYPFYLSHAHFREVMLTEKQREEKTTPAWVAGLVRETGGMIGLRTAPDEVNTYDHSAVANSCHGSTRSFAQAYDFGRLGLKVAMGLGSDLNGFIQQTRPRFGPDACSGSFVEEAQCQARDERELGPARLGTQFDELGLGHIGLLTDMLDELDALGSDSGPLRSSADDFVRMWERGEGTRAGPAEDAGDLDSSGITKLPRHYERKVLLPEECGEHYCPDALEPGTACRFDAECVSGVCAGAGECGSPTGECE
ncbi:MAG: membrane dipeptidase [Myxococcales bacterium]|nr:membrane dipeptidase [Myxococcales bacterium]